MAARKLKRVCIKCGKVYRPGHTSQCPSCVNQRNLDRPWYKTRAYRAAQRAAKKQTGRPCPRCGQPMVGKHRPSVDHVIPVARGGADGPLVVVCLSCNSRRGSGPL